MVTSSAPPALTPLLGRARERDRLDAILGGPARLVTLLGPPGIGKTRLAIEAHRGWEERGGQAAWIDLSTTERREELCARVAHALGVRLSWLGSGDMIEELGYAIEGQGSTLLVLDEAELSLAAIEEVVPRWLSAAPDTRALITSRARLGIAGESILELGPLPVDEHTPLQSASGQLLLTHAGLEAPARAEDRAALGQLVTALDGIPLAIELVASRLRVLSPDEILRRFLGDGLGAIEGRRRASPLRAALEASWQRLDDDERRALATCAVFVGSFDTAAAERVLGDGAVDLLQSLRDQSLLARHDRRHRLYSPVRAFAAARLDELGLTERAERDHAACYAGRAARTVAELRGPRGPLALRALTAEIDQLRAAHARALDPEDRAAVALAIAEVLVTRGPAADATTLLTPEEGRPALRVARGRALAVEGRVDEALAAFEGALDELDDDASRSWAASAASAAELARGNLDEARAWADRAAALAPARDPAAVEARRQLGVCQHARGALDVAAASYESARRLADELELHHRAAQLRADIGAVRLSERRLDEAREHYEAAVEQMDPETDPITLGLAEGNLAILEQELGDLERAAALHTRGVSRLRRIGHRLYVAHLSGYAGAVEHERGRHDEAAERYHSALDGLRRVGDARLTAVVASLLGALEAERGRPAAAEEAFEEADAALTKVEDPGVHAAVELHRHQLAIARSDDERARGAALEAIEAASGDPATENSDDARIALRLLRRRIGHGAITLSVDAHRVTLPDGESVDLASRQILWRLVYALGRARSRDRRLDPHALLAAGWPGESPTGESGLNRVKVALSTLRKLGLREVLVRNDEGYALDPRVPVILEGDA